jgi:hypothetical protein
LSAKNGCRVATATHEQPMNIYTIFVGYTGTGKSSAIQHGCLGPLASLLDNELSIFILDRPTSSGLVKHISTKKSTFIVSPEIYDVLNKLLKNDEDNASGDAMLLCKMFSRRSVFLHILHRKQPRYSRQHSFRYPRLHANAKCSKTNRKNGPRTRLDRPLSASCTKCSLLNIRRS